MKNLMHRLQRNSTGVFGVLITLFIGGLDAVLIWIRGPEFDEMHAPLGMLLQSIASQFTPAPSLINAGSDRAVLLYWLFFGSYLLISLVFAALLWWCTGLANGLFRRVLNRQRDQQRSEFIASVLQSLQLVLALLMDTGLLYVLAAELAVVWPRNKAWRWLALQVLLSAILAVYLASTLLFHDRAIKVRLLYLGGESIVQILMYAATWLAMQERRGRLKLAAAHAELQATQTMLSDTVRASERLRIARDLHDAIGHHLTALNLHLDLAVRQPPEQRDESLQISSDLAKSMLAEVRSVVSAERHGQGIHLQQALATLCAGIPTPRIQLDFDHGLEISSPGTAHTLFYCLQEAISNTVRHAHASQLWISFRQAGAELHIHIADDGIGICQASEGNGLRGMRERLLALHGNLRTMTPPQGGHHLDISLPMASCI